MSVVYRPFTHGYNRQRQHSKKQRRKQPADLGRRRGTPSHQKIAGRRAVAKEAADGALMEFVTAGSLDEALDTLSKFGPEAAVVAGGTAVLYQLSAGMRQASRIVHIERLSDLSHVSCNGGVRIGALTTMRAVAESPDLASRCSGLVTAAASCGGWQTQFVATVGGNVCNASPGADLAPSLLVHDAQVTLASADRGARSVPLAAFFTGFRQTAREPDELMTEIAFDTPPARTADVYVKVRRRGAMELPIVGVATRVTLDESLKTIADIRIAACAAGPVPFRADKAEAILKGAAAHDAPIAEAGAALVERASLFSDARASAEYRRAVLPRVLTHAIEQCVSRARADGSGSQ